MTVFPEPNPANPARRVKIHDSIVVAIRSEGSQPIRAKLHDLSATGGLLRLSKALEEGDFVELAFPTSAGTVAGMAEILATKQESPSGCMQPFRFVALDDENHSTLHKALEALLYQTLLVPRPWRVERRC
jgi:hypothetical protein